jgi:cytosine/creatinine deaminase
MNDDGPITPLADVVLRRCRIEGTDGTVDIAISGERIADLGPSLPLEADLEVDLEGRIASPAFVQPHLHLDKVGVGSLLGSNRSGTLSEAISLLHRTKRDSTVEDVAARAGRVIREAVLAGTTFIRSHVDVDTIGGLIPLAGVRRAAEEHADVCDVEIVAFPQEGILRDPGTKELLRHAMDHGANVVGGMPHWELSPEASRRHIEFCMDLAVERNADVDMHVDETDDPASRTLEMLIDATAMRGWQGRVSAGHCCAMAAWEDEYAARIIREAAETGVSVITNPATNLFLQGRGDHEPRRRGIPRIKEIIGAGVRLAAGQDCVEDAFYPFGACDQLQVALILCHAAQLTTPDEIGQALSAVRTAAAALVGIRDYGLRSGARADIVVIDADDIRDALRRLPPRTLVVHRGRIVAATKVEPRLFVGEGRGASRLAQNAATMEVGGGES